MSGMQFSVEGLAEVFKNLDLTVRSVNRATNEALNEGGDVVKQAIEENTPVGDGSKGGHAKDDVIKNNVSTSDQFKSIDIGYGPGSFWYMWFVEKGTYSKGNPKGIAPRNHFQRAWQGSYSEAFQKMQEVMASRGLM